MDPMTIIAIMSGIGALGGMMKGGQQPMQSTIPQQMNLGAKPPMQVQNPYMSQMMPPNMMQPGMMPQQNRFSSALGRYGGLM